MHKKHIVFAGRRIPGTIDYAVSALRAACSISTPENNERSWRIANAIGRQEPIPGKRVWYRIPDEELGDSYISVWPGGEYATAKPAGEADVILELPDGDDEDTLADRLAALLEYLKSNGAEERDTLLINSLLVSFDPAAVTKQEESLFVSANESIRTGKRKMSDCVDDLLEKGLFDHGEHVMTFAANLALLNIQHMLNQWVEPTQSWVFDKKKMMLNHYDKPFPTFRAYVEDRASSGDRSRLESALKLIGDTNYLEGKKAVSASLEHVSLVAFTRYLTAAANYYVIAMLVAAVAEENGLKVSLIYGVVQAEEGFACTRIGLLEPALFLFNDAINRPQMIARLLNSGKTEAEIAFRTCSAVWPRFTKKFFKVLMATARTLRPGESLNQGITELLILQGDYDKVFGAANVEFERGWIDWALMNAYMIKGDEEKARQYAQKIVVYFMIHRELGNGSQSPNP